MELNNYYYIQNYITGDILTTDGNLIIFLNINEAFGYIKDYLDDNWRVRQCSKHILDQ